MYICKNCKYYLEYRGASGPPNPPPQKKKSSPAPLEYKGSIIKPGEGVRATPPQAQRAESKLLRQP